MATDIDVLIAAINKKQKAQILFRGTELKNLLFPRTTTGCLSYDIALGGGWPLNCVNEIIGFESMGKTVMALKTIAVNQLLDPDYHTVWVASEDFDFAWAGTCGVDTDQMTFVMSNIMEEAYESCIRVMEERAADAIIIDSLPALMPSEEDQKSMMELTIGRGAMLTNKFMRKAIAASGRSLIDHDRNVLCLVINQWRERVGVIWGDSRTTPGGLGKNYTYMTRVEVSRDEWLKDGDDRVGQTIKAQTIKNKTAPPRRSGQVDFYFAPGGGHQAGDYDTKRDVWSVATEQEVLERKGAWYHFGSKKWNGRDAVWQAMEDDPALTLAIDTEVRRQLGLFTPPRAVPTSPIRRRRSK